MNPQDLVALWYNFDFAFFAQNQKLPANGKVSPPSNLPLWDVHGAFEIFSVVEQRQPIKMRISSMDSFLFSLEENLERQVYISGFRIIFLADLFVYIL